MWCEWWKLNIDIKWKLFTDNGHEQPGEIHFLRVKSVILTKPPVLSCHPPNVYFSPQTACQRNTWSQVKRVSGFLLDVLLQLLAGGVSGNLDQMSIGSREVRVLSVRKYQWDKSGNSNKKKSAQNRLWSKRPHIGATCMSSSSWRSRPFCGCPCRGTGRTLW